ncbi:MAG: FkbM family methyltransferase [Alphaproteobacteria bacterium]|nr:FkbM family methyltransferase [Alphaproteobacteria bacterium]MBU0803407.1 FkbM family methyltransferase [Alphaproteobacteria bacterium]MBU0871943.1 FkbM family methyltransferase [Alphaproteobacteria bacterium]MBU1402336.1 FkbM family methyltransferase [Alphaproteobacteria bacterium]MBU1590981.1 FkbM family methyltransferase [Alphaproteobacteria bacterium]
MRLLRTCYGQRMLEESRAEFMLRWHLYRRWKKPPSTRRQAEYSFHKMLDGVAADSIFLDLGANVGHVSAKALEHNLKVIAFEPDPAALTLLRSRFGNNPNIEIIPKAVGASNRAAKLHRRTGDLTEWSSLIEFDFHADDLAVDVEVVDLVDFVRQLPRPVGVMKMDIEGAEAECLEALLDSGLHRSVGTILVETHDRFSNDLAARLDAIRARIEGEGIDNIDLTWV